MHIFDKFFIYLKKISEFIRFSPLIFHPQNPNVKHSQPAIFNFA